MYLLFFYISEYTNKDALQKFEVLIDLAFLILILGFVYDGVHKICKLLERNKGGK